MTFLAKSNAKINNRHIPSICTNQRSFYPETHFKTVDETFATTGIKSVKYGALIQFLNVKIYKYHADYLVIIHMKWFHLLA